jgi:hypothetical protein
MPNVIEQIDQIYSELSPVVKNSTIKKANKFHISNDNTQKDFNLAMRYLAGIPADDYHNWIKVAAALSHRFGDAGFSLFNSWSMQSSKYTSEAECRKKWDTFTHDRSNLVTFGTLKHLYDSYNQEKFSIKSYSVLDMVSNHYPKQDLVSGRLLVSGGISMIAGQSKIGKSFFTINFCIACALGVDFLGFKIPKPLKVYYLNAEIKREYFAERLRNLRIDKDQLTKLSENFYVSDRFSGSLTDQSCIDAIISDIENAFGEDNKPDLIVIDPLANVCGGDENDNSAMLKFFQDLRNRFLDKVNKEAATLIIHHTGKAGYNQDEPFNSLRGASAIRGFYDAAIMLSKISQNSDMIKLDFEVRNGKSIKP